MDSLVIRVGTWVDGTGSSIRSLTVTQSPPLSLVCTWAQDERPADLHMTQPNVPVSKPLSLVSLKRTPVVDYGSGTRANGFTCENTGVQYTHMCSTHTCTVLCV
jgi:hypothetical protein